MRATWGVLVAIHGLGCLETVEPCPEAPQWKHDSFSVKRPRYTTHVVGVANGQPAIVRWAPEVGDKAIAVSWLTATGLSDFWRSDNCVARGGIGSAAIIQSMNPNEDWGFYESCGGQFVAYPVDGGDARPASVAFNTEDTGSTFFAAPLSRAMRNGTSLKLWETGFESPAAAQSSLAIERIVSSPDLESACITVRDTYGFRVRCFKRSEIHDYLDFANAWKSDEPRYAMPMPGEGEPRLAVGPGQPRLLPLGDVAASEHSLPAQQFRCGTLIVDTEASKLHYVTEHQTITTDFVGAFGPFHQRGAITRVNDDTSLLEVHVYTID